MKSNLFVQAAIAASVLVVAGCDKDAEKTQLQTPEPKAVVESTTVECTVTWKAVENAAGYSWTLCEAADPATVVSEETIFTDVAKTFSNLKEDTEYV
ncbi:MAG: hypothetical protein KIG75_07890, partial [Bacteroidales bacterium]|nr:hypothetical protein [Bacteroidales bacterium]